MLNLEQLSKYSEIVRNSDSVTDIYGDIETDLGRAITEGEKEQLKLYMSAATTVLVTPPSGDLAVAAENISSIHEFTKVDRIKELADTIAETYRRKNADYGDSFGISVHKYGIIAALTRMSDKWNRLENLILNMNQERNVADESVLDTLLDMATYALMTYMEIERM